eukprot:TRINITY_DN606_c1_g1_i2.p1 TRINITY_DN606_c1_g1~~TRINITY_DN606_c1_g1_i2.p1  ORF type:complete len:526 (-),score=72.23 TRINITY_DN606_c1_g1_i2:224-1801(-)
MEAWIPKGSHLVRMGPGSTMTTVDSAFHQLILFNSVRFEYAITFDFINVTFVHLCLTGLNIWTLVGYAAIVGVQLLELLVAAPAYGWFGVMILLMLEVSVVGVFVILAILLERVQRQKFLAETLLAHQMDAAEMADGILNHVLKNTLADVAGYIELFLAGSSPADVLGEALHCLRRAMKACRDRQAYLKLMAGVYKPIQTSVNLQELVQDLVADQGVRVDCIDDALLMDRSLVTLILDTALAQAFRHGRPENPDVALTIGHVATDEPLDDDSVRIEFVVTSAVDPDVLMLGPVTSLPAPTSPDDIISCGRSALVPDGIGLRCSVTAAQLAGLTFTRGQVGGRIEFRVVGTFLRSGARRLSLNGVGDQFPSSHPSDEPLPSRLCFFVMDDAAVSRCIMEHHIRSHCPTAVARVFGAQESDVELFPALAAEQADVVVLDQHLDYRESYLGTDIAKQLLRLGYRGLVCIRSSEGSPADLELYAAAGAHVYIGKDVGGEETMRRIKTAYQQFRSGCLSTSSRQGAIYAV